MNMHTDRQDFNTFVLPEGTCVISGSDRYIVGPEIGRGGFGTMYAATLSGHHFALKIAVGDIPIRKLAHEASITAELARTNAGVLPIRVMQSPEIHMTDGQVRAAFETGNFSVGIIRDMSESGMSLADILQEKDTDLIQSLIQGVDLMMALIRVLEPIHEQDGLGYIHGDISPENIIVLPPRNMVLFIDFGNAQRMDKDGFAEIAREEIAYNPVFMAPELRAFINRQEAGANGAPQIFAQDYSSIRLTKASDIYSLGMIFYALLFETPNLETCEHIAVLTRNRVQAHFGAGLHSKTLVRLLQNLFDECLAPDEQDRIADTIRLKERLLEIRDVVLGFAVTKAGLQAQSEERLLFAERYGAAETPDTIRFRKWMRYAGTEPLFLYGIRGSGKTVLLKSVCAELLEQGDVIPLLIDAEELPDTNEPGTLLRGIAQTVFRRLFGGFGQLRTENESVSALVSLLGFEEFEEEAKVTKFEYLLVIDDMHVLTQRTHMLDAFAKALPGITKTAFVFCGKAPPVHYENAAFTGLFADENIFRFANPAIYRESLSFSAFSHPTALADDELFHALSLRHRADIEERYPFLTALAYDLRGVSPGDCLPPEAAREYSFRRAVWDGILEEMPIRFQSAMLADFFAAHYVAETIIGADEPEALFPVNHVWRRGLVRMLRVFPGDLWDSMVNRVDILFSDIAGTAGNKPDLIPSNIFALTGDTKWALLSLKVADRFFHEEILDGYFTYGSTVFPCAEFAKHRRDSSSAVRDDDGISRNDSDVAHNDKGGGFVTGLDFSGEHLPEAVSKLPDRIRLSVAADLKYGYRLDTNLKLAAALEQNVKDFGRKRMFGGGG